MGIHVLVYSLVKYWQVGLFMKVNSVEYIISVINIIILLSEVNRYWLILSKNFVSFMPVWKVMNIIIFVCLSIQFFLFWGYTKNIGYRTKHEMSEDKIRSHLFLSKQIIRPLWRLVRRVTWLRHRQQRVLAWNQLEVRWR